MMRVFHLNCGSSGAEDAALAEAVRLYADLAWAEMPEEADVFVLTGPIPQLLRAPLLRVWREQIQGRAPLVAIGRPSIDGQPFGRGGIAELAEVQATVKVDGTPPQPEAIRVALKQATQIWQREQEGKQP